MLGLSHIFPETLGFTNLDYNKHGKNFLKWLQAEILTFQIFQEAGYTSGYMKRFILLAKATKENHIWNSYGYAHGKPKTFYDSTIIRQIKIQT